MKPPAFDYERVDSAEQALDSLAQLGEDARILAGGQSLMPMLNMRLASPKRLIDIGQCKDLQRCETVDQTLEVGAALTQQRLLDRPQLSQEVPLLAMALPHISHFQIRNRGTVVGSIAHADPAAELPLCLLTLEASVQLRNSQTARVVTASDFLTGLLSTSRQDDEMIDNVRFPLAAPGSGYGFEEFSLRQGDLALCSIACVIDDKTCRIGVGGVADRPFVQNYPRLTRSDLDDALNELAWFLDPVDEPQASAALRRQLVSTLGKRAVARALSFLQPKQ